MAHLNTVKCETQLLKL